MAKTRKSVLPSLLSFSGSIRPSVFFMNAGLDNGTVVPILVQETTVLGGFQNEMSREKAVNKVRNSDTETKGNPKNANPQRTEIALTPQGTVSLTVSGSLHIRDAASSPYACNDPSFTSRYKSFLAAVLKTDIFPILAERYAMNLITGQWLWNNRILTDDISITIGYKERGTREKVSLTFDANDYDDTRSPWPTAILDLGEAQRADAQRLTTVIAQALSKPHRAALELHVYATLAASPGVVVSPSEEMVPNKDEKDSSKILFSMTIPGTQDRQAAMHPQKIGNALRTIDQVNGFDQPPIAVSAYGTVTRKGEAYRLHDGKNDFYTLMDQLDDLTKKCEDLKGQAASEDMIYLVAMFVLGGVFGLSTESKDGGKKGDKDAPKSDETESVDSVSAV